MEMLFRIEVTREDIEQGKPGNCVACPITRAIKRTLHDPIAFSMPTGISVLGQRYDCDPTVTEWMMAFDHGKNVEPFTLLLTRNDSGELLTARMEEEA